MIPLASDQLEMLRSNIPAIQFQESLARYTYLKIGGPAAALLNAPDRAQLESAIQAAQAQQIPWVVLGGGSNVLVADEGFAGLVIIPRFSEIQIDGMKIRAEAGAQTALVARKAAEAGLSGFSWGVGVPGTIGGAVFGNAGCFGGEMKDVVESVDVFDPIASKVQTIDRDACQFRYRGSIFSEKPWIILSATLRLSTGDPAVIKTEMETIMSKRRETQPQGTFTAGCLFKNVDLLPPQDVEKLQREVEVPSEFLSAKRIPAGWLIDRLGLKGKTIGKAQISPVHGNFLVNLGGATAQDVLQLASLVKMKVRDELGILLEDEIRFVG